MNTVDEDYRALASSGRFEVLRWAAETYPQFSYKEAVFAVLETGKMTLVRELERNIGQKISDLYYSSRHQQGQFVNAAIKSRNPKLLEYILKVEGKGPQELHSGIDTFFSIAMAKIILDNCTFSAIFPLLIAAVEYCSIPVIEFLLHERPSYPIERLLERAQQSCRLDILRWYEQKGFPTLPNDLWWYFPASTRSSAAKQALVLELARFLHEANRIEFCHRAFLGYFYRASVWKSLILYKLHPNESSLHAAITSPSYFALETVCYLMEDQNLSLKEVSAIDWESVRRDVMEYLTKTHNILIPSY